MRTSFNIPDEMLAEYIEAHARLDEISGEVVSLVAFDYEHERVIEALHDAQHEFQDVIITTSHMHADEWCLETVFCRGPAKRVRELVYELRNFDGVSRVKVMLLRPA